MLKILAPLVFSLVINAHVHAQIRCPIDGNTATAIAAKKGYKFSILSSTGNATCQILNNGQNLVISATSSTAGECKFSIFEPPEKGQPLMVLRVILKSAMDSNVRHGHKDGSGESGIVFTLGAKKKETLQYRIAEVELPSIEGKCEKNRIEAQL